MYRRMTHLERVVPGRLFVNVLPRRKRAATNTVNSDFICFHPDETVRYSGHNVRRPFFFRSRPLRGQKIHVRPDSCKGARYYNESSRKLKEGPLCILPRIHT